MREPITRSGGRPQEFGWRHAGFFVLRTPFLPFNELAALGDGLQAPGVAPGPLLEAALAHDRALVQQRLRDLTGQPDIRTAIYTASPSLEASLDAWRTDSSRRRSRKVEASLVHYLYRMASRPTPFGLCAGISVGAVGATDDTCLQIPSRRDYHYRTRVDGSCLNALADALARQPAIQNDQTYFTNSTLYPAAGKLRYLETHSTLTKRAVDLVAVEPDPHLLLALDRARHGASRAEVIDAVCADDEAVSRTDAAELVDDLITAQLLVPEMSPPVTGPDPLQAFMQQLARHAKQPEAQRMTSGLRQAGHLIAAKPVGAGPLPLEHLRAAERAIAALTPDTRPGRILQVDLVKPAETLHLHQDVAGEIFRGVDLLRRIGGGHHRDPLQQFRRDFHTRYGDREAPLCEVLDDELGIGFAGNTASLPATVPLLQGLKFQEPQPRAVMFTERDRLLLRWTMDALQAGQQEIVLSDRDVEQLERVTHARGDLLPLPDAFSAVATILAGDEGDVTRGTYRLLLSHASGPGGANAIGRFCHGDSVLTGKVREYLQAEQRLQPHAVFAEIVHLPHSRAGNILFRPLLREYDIPFLARSGAPPERQIPIADLLVSVVDRRVVLRSRRLGREIIPRLTSAHNFESRGNLPLYQFLGYLQWQGVAGRVTFSFGALSSAPFLPRVVYRRFILTKAQWNLTEEQIAPLLGACPVQRFEAMCTLRQQVHMPRWVAITEGDRQLVIDTENTVSLDAAIPLLRDRRTVRFVETLHGSDACVVQSPEGSFTHELVVPYVRAHPISSQSPPTPTAGPGRTSFPPGSEWLYARLYPGNAGADTVLEQAVHPVVREALASGAADGWFFVRYADPDWHLRVRIHGDATRLFSQVAPALAGQCADLLASDGIWRLQFDTYEREVLRYGGPTGVELAERLFHADSEAVLDIIAAVRAGADADGRWLAAVIGTDRLLEDLGLGLRGKRAVTRAICQRLRYALGVDHDWNQQISRKFRSMRPRLEAALARPQLDGLPEPACSALDRRSRALEPLVAELRQAERANALTRSISELAESFVHMHINRVLDAATTSQEFVVCELLDRVYQSRIARQAV